MGKKVTNVATFKNAEKYKEFVDYRNEANKPIKVVSTLLLNGEIVVTYEGEIVYK